MTVQNPWSLSVIDLIHRPGEMRERQLDVPTAEDMGNAVIGVKAGTDVHLDVRLESLHDGVHVWVGARWRTSPCRL